MYDIEKVKLLLIKMNQVGYLSKKELSVEQQLLKNEVEDTALTLFSEIKAAHPNYTLENNKELKRYKVSEGEENEPSLAVSQFFQGNSKALHELIAYTYFGKKKQYLTENHLFHISLFSSYSNDYSDIFFISKKRRFWILSDKETDKPLIDFISQYFIDIPDEIRGRLERLFDQGDNEHDEIQLELTDIARVLSEQAKQKNYNFQSGAITFMDFLGWKGLWQSRNNDENHLEKVSNLINNIKEIIQKFSCELFPHSEGIVLSKLISISDTIAIFTPQIISYDKIEILKLHARIARYVLEACVKESYPIRGAITYGKYNTQDNIMIGPGIDECASWHETCNWIGVHFTPSAELLLRSCGNINSEHIKEHSVPVKSGYPKVKYCVNWYVEMDKYMNLVRHVQALLPELSNKYMNTYEFLYGKEGYDGKDAVGESR